MNKLFHHARALGRNVFIVNLVLLTASCSPASTASDDFAKISKTYSIEIVVDPRFPVQTTYGRIDGGRADVSQLQAYASIFGSEFTRYPVSFVKRSQLKRVVLCSELYFAGQRRTAIPDFEHDTLYLDVARGGYDQTYVRKVMHHEFFHIIDYRDDGKVYEDDYWTSLNPAGFSYGSGGKNAQGLAVTSVLTEEFPGFLNHYSTTGVEEDKAELFAFLMVDPGVVQARVARDPVLAKKLKTLKALLERFCPEMNEQFWQKNSQR